MADSICDYGEVTEIVALLFAGVNMARILVLADVVRAHSNGVLIANEFKRQGHEVEIFDRRLCPEAFFIAYHKSQPELVFDASAFFCQDYIEWIRYQGVKIVIWYPDVYFLYTPEERPKVLKAFEICDLFITTMRGHVADSKPYTDKVVWFPGFFADSYYTGTMQRPEPGQFSYDVAFVGHAHIVSPQRKEYIEALRNAGLRLMLRGWPFGRTNYQGEIVADAYRQSKIGLNIASKGVFAKELQFSARVFQVMGCGTMLLCEKVEGMERLFEDGKHLVMYEGVDDLVEKALYYAEHNEERERIARCGQEEVFTKHLISIRVRQFLDEFKKRGFIK